MRTPELLSFLLEFYRDRVGLRARHEAGARLVTQYEFNNTYQYVIAREDAQLGWLQRIIRELGGEPEPIARAPDLSPTDSGAVSMRDVLAEDVRRARDFVDRWRPRVAALTNARQRRMLEVILGETVEHRRFFEQALAGRVDLLGRRADGAGTAGIVLASRWVE